MVTTKVIISEKKREDFCKKDLENKEAGEQKGDRRRVTCTLIYLTPLKNLGFYWGSRGALNQRINQPNKSIEINHNLEITITNNFNFFIKNAQFFYRR